MHWLRVWGGLGGGGEGPSICKIAGMPSSSSVAGMPSSSSLEEG